MDSLLIRINRFQKNLPAKILICLLAISLVMPLTPSGLAEAATDVVDISNNYPDSFAPCSADRDAISEDLDAQAKEGANEFSVFVAFLIGEDEYSLVEVGEDGYCIEPEKPSHGLYPNNMVTFLGWFENENPEENETAFDFSFEQVSADITLHARFSDRYVIQYTSGDGEVVMVSLRVVYESGNSVAPDLYATLMKDVEGSVDDVVNHSVRMVYDNLGDIGRVDVVAVDDGLLVDVELVDVDKNDGLTVNLGVMSVDIMQTLLELEDGSSYIVEFDSNGGTIVAEQYVPGSSLLTQPVTTRVGYTLVSWNKPNGEPWNFDYDEVNEIIILTANWSQNEGTSSAATNNGVGEGYQGTEQFSVESVEEYLDYITAIDLTTPLYFLDDHIRYIFGYPDGTVKPDVGITRAEAAQIFHRLLNNANKNDYIPSNLTDISVDEWYYQPVAYLESFGIINGYPDGTFRPGASITRAEYAAIASRFDRLASTEFNIFEDVSDNHWAVNYVNSAAAKGWINGIEFGYFQPDLHITRSQVVTVVNRMLNRSIRLDNVPSDAPYYSDLIRNHWAYCAIMEASDTHEYNRDVDNTEIWLDRIMEL
jgi:hypothetical protein